MTQVDIQSLRRTFIEQEIMLCFNGPFSATLIEEIGHALRRHMENMQESQSAVSDVFAAYIELAQNIRHYTIEKNLSGEDTQATLIVSHAADGGYAVCAGNVVTDVDGQALMARVSDLASQDKTALKALYKSQLRQPRDPAAKTGAGLGLIDLARKARQPLSCDLASLGGGRSFFSLRVII